MDEVFNPYYAFLGLDEEVTSPSFYQILRLRETESDAAKINAAADKATARARACRPGSHAVEWSRLLDEIQAARACLLDPAQRTAYDQQQQATNESATPQPAAPASNGRPSNPAALAAPAISFVAPNSTNFAYPPGAGPQPAASQPAASPAAPVVNPTPDYAPNNPGYAPTPVYPASPNTAYAANPAMAPYSPPPTFSPSPASAYAPAPSYPQYGGYAATMPAPAWNPPSSQNDPMAPMAHAWSSPVPPSGPAVAPPIAPASNPLDPMAPVAYAMQPESRPAMATPVAFASTAPMAVPRAVPVSQAAPVASVVVPSRPSGRPAKRPSKFPVALVVGIGGLSFLLVVLVIAWSMQGSLGQPIADKPDPSEPIEPAETDPSILPSGKPKPEPRVKPEKATPELPEEEMPKEEMPQDEVPEEEMPAPVKPEKPVPTPEPVKPEATKPEPPKPETTPQPTPAELAELSRLMKEAKTALGDFSFPEAEEALTKAEEAAKLPEHKATVQRLKAVADMAQKFRGAIQETMFKLEAGEVIKVGSTTEAAIVEAGPNKLIIRIAGQNRTYTLDDLPLGLAANLGERALNSENPTTRLLKGAYVFIDKRSDPAQLKKAKTWWEEAQLNGADIGGILPVFTDNYDFKSEATPE